MSPDSYQQAWQAHSSQTHVTIDADLLLQEVQREQRIFRALIFWRDFREVGIALVMLPIWFYLGVAIELPWTWYLTVPACLWVAGFILVDRMRHPQKASEPGEPLLISVRESLTQVDHQIWLLRNVFWWYLLPFAVSLLAFFAHVTWLASDGWWEFSGTLLFWVLFVVVLYASVYRLNQRAVRTQLEPRRRELLTLLASLGDETIGEGAADRISLPALPFTEARLPAQCASPARGIIGTIGFMVGMLLVVAILAAMVNTDPYFFTGEGYPKRSPFDAVRWQEYQPEVKLGDEWFKLVSLDGLPAAEIVAFSRRTYGNLWRKRFEEDLVELLTGMKHPPDDEVNLVLESLTSSETHVREDVPMTYANRRAIRGAAEDREIPEPRPERVRRTAVSIDNTEQFRQRIDEFLQLARVKAGISGVVVVARGGERVYEGALGFSHLESRTPNTLDTPFRIASLSKQFTAAAILHLEAEGKLAVDDPVHRYLPEFAAEPYRGITIHHLLSHTSGLPRIPDGETGLARWQAMAMAETPVHDYVQLACEVPLEFEPGQDYRYSNIGYRVLSALIARVTGIEYADFMEEKLFEPLGLSQSGVARLSQPPDEASVAETVSFVVLDRRSREPAFASTDAGRNYGTGYGSGGIYASANDLLRWDRILAGDSFLSAEQKAKLFRPVQEHRAYGWIVKQSGLDGRVYQTHSGANGGYFSQMMRIPEDDLVIIALGNVRKTDAIDEALEQLFRLCRSLPYEDL